jgi:hypothetical protein
MRVAADSGIQTGDAGDGFPELVGSVIFSKDRLFPRLNRGG